MGRSEQYRAFAQECLEMARTVDDPGVRATLKHMAEVWLRLAERGSCDAAEKRVFLRSALSSSSGQLLQVSAISFRTMHGPLRKPSRPKPTPSSCSIRPAGTCRPVLSCRQTSPSFRCRRNAPSSTRSKTSGRVHARQLALQPHLQILRRSRRPCCTAWNKLVDQPWRIMSIGLRQWAYGF